MKYPTGDLYDRYTIELLKRDRANADNGDFLLELLTEIKKRGPELSQYVQELYTVNGKIWDLESDIRRGKEGELGLEEVGRRALQIRDLNSIRISIKNYISEEFEEFQEKKYNHASA